MLRIGLAGAVAALASAPASAHLGSFTPADGYTLSVPVGSANWCDVSYYNAGAYGANSGGGSGPTLLVPDSGLWKLTSNAGGFFPNAAARNAAVGGAPPYPNTVPPGTVPVYMVGNHFPGRGGDGSNLAFRNDSAIGAGPAVYEYTLDTYDMGGSNPSSITSGTVTVEFYFCPNPSDPPNPGTPPSDKFTLSFMDTSSNIGVEWGYGRDNEVTWRTTAGGSWTYTGIYADATNWDGLRLTLDLSADTFMMEYYDISATSWTTLAPSGTALGVAMLDLTRLVWRLEDGVNSGLGGKNYFDDFSFVVPEPSTLVLASLGLAAVCRRRR
jgi:hypothetical protein